MAGWSDSIAKAGHQTRKMIRNALAQVWVVAPFAKSSKFGDHDAVSLADESDPSTRQPGQRQVTRVQPFGFSSRATNKVRAACVRLGSSNIVFLGIVPTNAYGAQDLEDGESSMWSAFGQLIRMWTSGIVTIDSKAGQTVELNGNTYSLPKWDTFATDLSTMLSTIGNLSPNPPTTLPQALADIAAIINAVNTFRLAMAIAGDYKSAKVKNG